MHPSLTSPPNTVPLWETQVSPVADRSSTRRKNAARSVRHRTYAGRTGAQHADVALLAQTGPVEISAEAAISEEISALGAWLAAHGIDLSDSHANAQKGSRDRLYWRYGYFMGLKQALAMLSSHGAVLH
jgi:hypothetical protein